MLIRYASSLLVRGRFHLEARDRNGQLVAVVDEDNMILDSGLEGLAAALASPGSSGRTPFAISIGDNGTLSGDPFTPIEPPASRTSLYHELGSTRVGLATNFEAVQTGAALQCSRSFDSTLLSVGDFADASKQYLNEAMVWLGKSADAPDTAWVPFAMRTFKSVPFGPVDAITAMIRWTFTFQRGS